MILYNIFGGCLGSTHKKKKMPTPFCLTNTTLDINATCGAIHVAREYLNACRAADAGEELNAWGVVDKGVYLNSWYQNA